MMKNNNFRRKNLKEKEKLRKEKEARRSFFFRDSFRSRLFLD